MVGITVRTVAYNFRIDLCPSLQGMLSFLQNEDSRSLAHHKSRTLFIERNGSAGECCRRRKGFHRSKAADSERGNHGFRSAANHRRLISVPNTVKSVADGIGTSGTGRHRTDTHSFQMVANRNFRCRHVGNGHRNEEGAHSLKSFG